MLFSNDIASPLNAQPPRKIHSLYRRLEANHTIFWRAISHKKLPRSLSCIGAALFNHLFVQGPPFFVSHLAQFYLFMNCHISEKWLLHMLMRRKWYLSVLSAQFLQILPCEFCLPYDDFPPTKPFQFRFPSGTISTDGLFPMHMGMYPGVVSCDEGSGTLSDACNYEGSKWGELRNMEAEFKGETEGKKKNLYSEFLNSKWIKSTRVWEEETHRRLNWLMG